MYSLLRVSLYKHKAYDDNATKNTVPMITPPINTVLMMITQPKIQCLYDNATYKHSAYDDNATKNTVPMITPPINTCPITPSINTELMITPSINSVLIMTPCTNTVPMITPSLNVPKINLPINTSCLL